MPINGGGVVPKSFPGQQLLRGKVIECYMTMLCLHAASTVFIGQADAQFVQNEWIDCQSLKVFDSRSVIGRQLPRLSIHCEINAIRYARDIYFPRHERHLPLKCERLGRFRPEAMIVVLLSVPLFTKQSFPPVIAARSIETSPDKQIVL
jgi:hypothetical protein